MSIRQIDWLRFNAVELSSFLELNDKFTSRIKKVNVRHLTIARTFLNHESIVEKSLFFTANHHFFPLRRLIPEFCQIFKETSVAKELFQKYDELCKDYFYNNETNVCIQFIRMIYSSDKHVISVYHTLPNPDERRLRNYFLNNGRILLQRFVTDYVEMVDIVNRFPREIYHYLKSKFNSVFSSYQHVLCLHVHPSEDIKIDSLLDERILQWYRHIERYHQLSGEPYMISNNDEVSAKSVWIREMKERAIIESTFCEECPSECSVCYESIGSKDKQSCGHHVHEQCIIRSKKACCPLCRQQVRLSDKALDELYSHVV